MKIGLITVMLGITFNCVYAQTNTLPNSGNVGIGTTSPNAKLQVNGSARIDSTLTVKDSMIVDRGAHIKSDLQVDGNTILEGNLTLNLLLDSTLLGDEVILIDSMGNLKRGGDLKSLVYLPLVGQHSPCITDLNGNIIPTAPYWQADPQRMYLINSHCSPDPRLGVGVKPEAKMHVRLTKDSDLHPLLIEKSLSGNPSVAPYKLMQLDNEGLLYARQVKVNLELDWPDYVFEEDYELMSLDELQEFIRKNNHLPNVPSACEMEEEGINVAKSNVMLMEKVEELTLYMLQLQDQLKQQQALISQQQEEIQLLKETLIK